MPRVNYNSSSPYFSTPQTRWYLGPIALRNIGPDSSDDEIEIDAKYEFRPDLLSYDLYGTPSYWWVFMIRNMDMIRDPIWDLKSGMKIWVPSVNRVNTLLK